MATQWPLNCHSMTTQLPLNCHTIATGKTYYFCNARGAGIQTPGYWVQVSVLLWGAAVSLRFSQWQLCGS